MSTPTSVVHLPLWLAVLLMLLLLLLLLLVGTAVAAAIAEFVALRGTFGGQRCRDPKRLVSC